MQPSSPSSCSLCPPRTFCIPFPPRRADRQELQGFWLQQSAGIWESISWSICSKEMTGAEYDLWMAVHFCSHTATSTGLCWNCCEDFSCLEQTRTVWDPEKSASQLPQSLRYLPTGRWVCTGHCPPTHREDFPASAQQTAVISMGSTQEEHRWCHTIKTG